MKILLFLSFCSFGLSGQQATGVAFQRAAFADLLAQAQREEKLLFIDAYTTWCGPCKMMDAKVFPDTAVAEVFNGRFINAKFDMEQGEGKALAERYSVAAYPTYLFVNGEGELVHKAVGYIPKSALLELADVAISDQSLGAMKERYEAGDRSPDFVSHYARTLTTNYEQAQADRVIGEYLEGAADWSAPENVSLILDSPGELGGSRMNFLISHAGEVAKTSGDRVYGVIERALVNDYHRSNRKRSLVAPEEIQPYFEAQAPALTDRLLPRYAMMFYQRQNDMPAYLSLAADYYGKFPSSDYAELNTLAWNFYEHSSDTEQLTKAIEWAKKSVELRPYYPNLDTLAWLYHKTGQMDKAKSTARLAIEYAKAESLDYSETEKILQ
ncbi:tetratricopeptide repeat protein [Neolewinella xylanilytica]|uniref:Tetratricopeptide repeat protein n=1 Tax=Neolewinella xylanilytica TaxID=1514080 RepID=A0A2S6I1N5_9BACT|nr:thioredoxin family protein [Neolewinella xylanilytica]PPK85096.1 tetratricopeptide repeat protein [Neolewinella xylanilytica]